MNSSLSLKTCSDEINLHFFIALFNFLIESTTKQLLQAVNHDHPKAMQGFPINIASHETVPHVEIITPAFLIISSLGMDLLNNLTLLSLIIFYKIESIFRLSSPIVSYCHGCSLTKTFISFGKAARINSKSRSWSLKWPPKGFIAASGCI